MTSKSEVSWLIRQQRFAEAQRMCVSLSHEEPDNADVWRMLARIASGIGDEDAEILSHGKIVAICPTRGIAHFNLASCLDRAGRYQEAEIHYRKALELNYRPDQMLNQLGLLLHKLHRSGEAIECCRKAVAKNKYLIDAWTNLGRIYADTAQPELALECMLATKNLAPASYWTHYNLGLVYDALLGTDEAIDSFRKALHLKPDFVDARWSLSLTLLRSGRFSEGWELYESRWQRGARNLQPRHYPQPLWDGSELKGRSIYLFAEQGLGDTLQFIRYARLLKSQGARVIFECQPQLKTLLRSMRDIDVLVTTDKSAPGFDTYAPLLSLPRILGTNIESIPSYSSYVSAPKELDGIVNRLLHLQERCLKVGVVWAGNPNHANDHNRSCKQAYFYRLCDIPDVQLFSLQKGKEGKKMVADHMQNRIVDLSPYLEDFAVTAGVIEQLDLVISVDTAVVHLAGALGKKAWVLLPFSPDWRWQVEGTTTAWYPSLRLFRQTRPGDWRDVFDRLVDELQAC